MDVDSLKAVNGNNGTKNDYTAITSQIITNKIKEKATSKKVDAKQGENNISDMPMNEKSKGLEQASAANKNNQEESYNDEDFQQKMERAIDAANKVLKPTHKSFMYSVHEETNEIMITIKDNDTGEIIKEIPSEETLDRVAKMRELAYGNRSSGGMVIDEKK